MHLVLSVCLKLHLLNNSKEATAASMILLDVLCLSHADTLHSVTDINFISRLDIQASLIMNYFSQEWTQAVEVRYLDEKQHPNQAPKPRLYTLKMIENVSILPRVSQKQTPNNF